MEQVKQISGLWAGLPQRTRRGLVLVAALTLVVGFVVVRAASHVDWIAVTTDVTPDKAGRISTALDEANIENRINETSTGIEVPKNDLSEARVVMAEANLLGTGSSTDVYEQIVDKQSKFGMTEADHELMRQRLLEELVAQDIQGIDGISGAEVRLVMAEEAVFSEDDSPATAGVTVDTEGEGVSEAKAAAIRQLVASAVQDLSPDSVSIVDETGKLAAASSADGSGGLDGTYTAAEAKLEVERRFNLQFEEKLRNKLEQIGGPDTVTVMSNATINMDKVQEESRDYGGEANVQGPVSAEDIATEDLETSNGGVNGVTGTTPNTTDQFVTGTEGDAESDYESDTDKRVYDNDSVARMVELASGNVDGHRLSVVVSADIPEGTRNAMQSLAETSIGGDTEANAFSFNVAEFPNPEDLAADRDSRAKWAAYVKYGKWGLLALGLLLIAYFLRRTLVYRTIELLDPSEEMMLLESGGGPIPLDELEAAVAQMVTIDAHKRQELQHKVEDVARRRPVDVASQLRGWMREDDMR